MYRILYLQDVGEMAGGETSLLTMIKYLNSNRFIPYVACPPGPLVDNLRALNIKVYEHDILQGILGLKLNQYRRIAIYLKRSIPAIIGLLKMAKRNKIDLIHANSPGGQLCGFLLRLLSGRKLIFHQRFMWRNPSVLFRYLFSVKKPNYTIFISEAVKLNYSKYLTIGNSSVVYNGVDIEDFFSSTTDKDYFRKKYHIADNKNIVAIVGRLTPWKGHSHFLQAAKEVVKKEQNVVFLIIGKPIAYQFGDSYKIQLKALASELNITDQIIFTGHENNMVRVMNAIDILVSTSFEEPFGRVLIEAMACAKPVIASNSGGVPEIIDNEKNGILVPYGDNNKLAEKIIELIRDKNMAIKLGLEGRRRVEENFDIRKLVKSIEDIYMEIFQ